MTTNQASIYLTGNNYLLNETLKTYLREKNLNIVNEKTKKTDYRLFVYDLGEVENNPPENIFDDLDSSADFTGKTCYVLVSYSGKNEDLVNQYSTDIQPYATNGKSDLRIIQTRDIYHDGDKAITEFERNLCRIKKTKRINVTADGSRKYYPTNATDLVELIIKSLFITNTGGKVFYGLTEEITDLELAYLIKKTLEKTGESLDINLDGKEKPDHENPLESSVQTQAQLNWIPRSNFTEVLPTLLDYPQPKNETENQETAAKVDTNTPELERLKAPEKNYQSPLKAIASVVTKLNIHRKTDPEKIPLNLHQKEKKWLARTIVIGLSSAVALSIIPIAIFISSLYLSTTNTYQSFKEIRNGEPLKSQAYLQKGRIYHQLAADTYRFIIPFGRILDKNLLDTTNNYLLVLGHGQTLIESINDTYSLGNQLYLKLLGKQEGDPKTITAALRINLVSISEKLSQLQLLYGKIKLPFGYGDLISSTDVNQSANLLKSQITLALPVLDLVEKIGTNLGLQRYLVVVQDTNELRPTGGFITTYGILTLDQGKIIDFQIDSSLSLDRLIEGKIDPPNIAKQLLGVSNWSFHDSNLDADFNISAKQMAWFYQRFKSVDLDGVIGMNTNFLNFILEQTGPRVLADNQEVSRDNLSSLASNPTASKGLDIITALTQNLGNSLTLGQIPFANFGRALLKAVSLHEITVWFKTPLLESLSVASDISGGILPKNCHPQLLALNCRADTIYLNESNMSVNKINYYLKRNQNLEAEIDNSGKVSYIMNYDYSYPVPVPNTQSTPYKAYYQLYLPPTAQNMTISLDAKTLEENSLVKSDIVGFTKIEFSASLSMNQPHHLEIHFISPNPLDLKKQFVPYTFAILKQPGTLGDSLAVKIRYPKSLQARSMTVPLKQTSEQELVFQTKEVSQENIGIIFKNTAL